MEKREEWLSIEKDDPTEFVSEVNAAIADGWRSHMVSMLPAPMPGQKRCAALMQRFTPIGVSLVEGKAVKTNQTH